MAIELQMDVYKGKSLDEIDLSLESEYSCKYIKSLKCILTLWKYRNMITILFFSVDSSEPSGDVGEGHSSAEIFNDDSSQEASDMDGKY